MRETPEQQWFDRLLEVGRSLVTELDLDAVLDRVLDTVREITGARYAAIGVLNAERTELSQFLFAGIDERQRAAIGDLPRGRGILGVLIEHPEPLRLGDVGRDPRSYGFPAGHPPMHSFLGVPVTIRGQAWGNLYLAEKQDAGGQGFTAQDERWAIVLADWAAVAIDNARLFETSERRREELEHAVRGLEATRDIAVALGGEIELAPVLELIAKRGRALVSARSVVIMLSDGDELVVRTAAGHVQQRLGTRLPVANSAAGQALQMRRAERIADVPSRLGLVADELGAPDAQTALLVPMLYRGDPVGVLVAFDRGDPTGHFSGDDEQMLKVFAASAATAVALAQSVRADRLRTAQAAADAERSRWARELHDETLQSLGGLRVLLAGALRRDDAALTREAMSDAVERIESEISNLRSIITELRPAALDELGLHAAIEGLLDRHREQTAMTVDAQLDLAGNALGEEGMGGELQTAIYRLIQEALTNVAKHSRASNVNVAVTESAGEVDVTVHDDGVGFDVGARRPGFGLAGMRERVELAGGSLRIDSGPDGTTLAARLPVPAAADTAGVMLESGADEAAG